MKAHSALVEPGSDSLLLIGDCTRTRKDLGWCALIPTDSGGKVGGTGALGTLAYPGIRSVNQQPDGPEGRFPAWSPTVIREDFKLFKAVVRSCKACVTMGSLRTSYDLG